MRNIILGLGVQGKKRQTHAGKDIVATVDPVSDQAQYRKLEDVPLNCFDGALLCVPDEPKIELITYLLNNQKHVLVEKPLWAEDSQTILKLESLARNKGVVLYTAYNHRFEPHFMRMKQLIDSNVLGEIYHCRMFYGNGTARLVRESAWRDKGGGVLPDLGSHLLDTVNFWFGTNTDQFNRDQFSIVSAATFENAAPDHVVFKSNNMKLQLEFEMTLLSWRNHFTCDIWAEKGSAHISSLCKWGPSTFTHRKRILPSGYPEEKSETLVQSDPTWALEYQHFKAMCKQGSKTDLSKDLWLNNTIHRLVEQALALYHREEVVA